MKRGIIRGLITLLVAGILIRFMLPEVFSAVFHSAYILTFPDPKLTVAFSTSYHVLGTMGVVITVLDMLLDVTTMSIYSPDFIYYLAPWLVAGLLAGFMARNPVRGLGSAFFAGFFAGVLMNILLWIGLGSELISLKADTLYMLITRNIVDGFIIGVPTGFAGLIGGSLLKKEELVKREFPELFPIETTCPKCGTRYASTPVYCAVCSAELQKSES